MSDGRFIRISPLDNVAVALTPLRKGEQIGGVILLEDIKQSHKFALKDLTSGDQIIKYGSPIGQATRLIKKGEWVHTHNIRTAISSRSEFSFEPQSVSVAKVDLPAKKIMAYKRAGGAAGIRNQIWVIPLVGCINGLVRYYLEQFENTHPQTDNYDGLVFLEHPYGCSQLGDDLANTKTTLRRLSLNPNVGGLLLIGLGCENNQMSEFLKYEYDANITRHLILQEVKDERESILTALEQLYQAAILNRREPLDLSAVTIGVKCGGSDGLSGIYPNPLIGRFADYHIQNTGAILLTEIPEMFGAEPVLLNRSQNDAVFSRFVGLIDQTKQYFVNHGQNVYENPSPGNKEGGISTLEEKSLGCVQKGGTATVTDVLNPDDMRSAKPGLSIVWSPGNDLVSCTQLAAFGAALILFSTGRGTPFGSVVPTVKIASNDQLYDLKRGWLDFNAAGHSPENDLTESLLNLIVAVCNGQKTKNETYKSQAIAIFKEGVTL
jgi:altronate hydrolase